MFPLHIPTQSRAMVLTNDTSAAPAPHATDDLYHTSWDIWSREANHGSGERRDLAVTRLKDCQQRQAAELNLSRLGLTTLPPDIPRCVTALNVSANDLDQIPSCALHEGLLTLFACTNPRLSALPERLPSTLRALHINNCDLQALPESWPPALSELVVYENPKLTALPNTLPDSLKIINVSFCGLTMLPERLPPNLEMFLAINNALTTAPEILTGLHKECFINVMRNPFQAPVFEQLNQLMTDASYDGPHLYLDFPNNVPLLNGSPDTMAILNRFNEQMTTGAVEQSDTDSANDYDVTSWSDPPVPLTAMPLYELSTKPPPSLEDIMATWYPPAQQADAIRAWHPHVTTAAGQEFLYFLSRLSGSINAMSVDFKEQLCQWLDELLKPQAEALREQTFNVAFEASTDCEDRATLALIHMQNARVVFDVERGHYDQTLPDLIACAREMFRQEAIERIARHHIKTELNTDEVDVYLAFLIKLRRPLQLRWAPQRMAFFTATHITQTHLDEAEATVKRSENTDFTDWLCNWAPWSSALARLDPERHQSMQQLLYDALDTFDTRLAHHLSAAQLSDDADAQRIGGHSVFEKITLDIKRQSSNDFLAARQLQTLLAPSWPA